MGMILFFVTGLDIPVLQANPVFYANFSNPPDEEQWLGDLSFFRTAPFAPEGKLRLDADPESGTAYLATREVFSPVQWEWHLRQAFSPSDNNRAFYYLNADKPELNNGSSGFIVRTGESGSPKHFRLFRVSDGSPMQELMKSDMEIDANTGYRIRMVRSPDNEMHMYLARGPDQLPLLQSETVSLQETGFRTMGHFGFQTHFTATRSDQFYFGDITLSEMLPEPGIEKIRVSASDNPDTTRNATDAIQIFFRVPPDSSHLNPENFRLNDDLFPVEIDCEHPQICTVGFDDTLDPGEYTLYADSYLTIYNQLSPPEHIPVRVHGQAEEGDVVINEFLYHPSGYLPAYVELYNRSDKLLNLRNWQLHRRALAFVPDRLISDSDLYIRPGEFIVLTPDSSALKSKINAGNVMEMPEFPSFNIAFQDEIRIFSDDGLLIDSLQYSPSVWGGNGVALERKSTEVPGWFSVNWSESDTPEGGTPGFPNSVNPPVNPPRLTNINYEQADRILLVYDRMLHPENTFDEIELHNDLRLPVQIDTAGHSSISVKPETPLGHGVHYNLFVSGVRDLFGNVKPDTSYSFRFIKTDTADISDVVINEVLYRPDSQGNHRFVELFNRSEKAIDLRGWAIGRSSGNPVEITAHSHPAPVHIMPKEKVVISEAGLVVSGNESLHLITDAFPSFSRLGDAVYLRSENGIIVDSLYYLPEWGGNRDGISLERIDPDGASADPANWRSHPSRHTAGDRNYHFNDNPGPPLILYAGMESQDVISVVFNRFVTKQSLGDALLEGRKLEITPDYDHAGTVYFFRSDRDIHRKHKKLTITSFTDVAGRTQKDFSIPLSFPPVPGDLIINEIMYQPLSERYSDRPDQSEYIEIYNLSSVPVQLHGMHIHDRPDKNGAVRKMEPSGLRRTALAPDSYAVFYADTSHTFETTRIFQAFPVPPHAIHNFYRVDRLTLGFSAQGDEIYLSDRNGNILDSLWYQPDWHNPNLIDTRGLSLERIHARVSAMDHRNWTSSTTSEGGTPGFENSVSAPVASDIQTGLKLKPNPFSPTGDGMDDHLIIHYKLDHPDYLMHVRVFDRHGRLVRTLANGERAGHSGHLIWDGRTQNGMMNRVGLYIIHFKALHPTEQTSKVYKKVTVLAAPL